MSDEQLDGAIARLKDNLTAAGIRYTEADIAGMVEKGFLRRLAAFDTVAARTAPDLVPDYLAAWGDVGDLDDMLPTEGSLPVPITGDDELPESPAPATGDPRFASIATMAVQVESGAVSPVELTEQALAAIAAADPALNAFQLVLAEQARATARQAEAEIR